MVRLARATVWIVVGWAQGATLGLFRRGHAWPIAGLHSRLLLGNTINVFHPESGLDGTDTHCQLAAEANRFGTIVRFGEVCMTSLFRFQMKPRTGRFILRIVFVLSVLFPVMASAQVAITTTALPAGNTSNIYTATLAATGGTAPYTWQLTGGSLPTGLTLSSAGVISGQATTVTPGTPPVPASFTVQVTDSAQSTATQAYSITVLAPGSHSLVINQFFSGGNGSTSSPYAYNYLEVFNASPSVIDLQNWTVQIAPATSAFSQTGVYPLGSLDPYTAGTTGGSDGHGNYPAFQITYSAAFTANNCNPAATSTQLNAAFPALHCWLNPGQFMLVLLGTTSATGALTTLPQITPDLDLTDGYINGAANGADTGAVLGNVGAIAATSSA